MFQERREGTDVHKRGIAYARGSFGSLLSRCQTRGFNGGVSEISSRSKE